MDHLLRLLIEQLSFLYKEHGFKIIDSLHSESFGGNGLLTLSDGILVIQLTRDRDQILCDFKAHKETRSTRWYSIDVVRQLLTSEAEYHALLDKHNLAFIRDRLLDIRECFTAPELENTYRKLKQIKSRRMKYMSDKWRQVASDKASKAAR